MPASPKPNQRSKDTDHERVHCEKLNYLFDVFDANANGAVSADDFARVIENYHTLGAMEVGTEESEAFTAHILSWWQALSTDLGGAETIGP